jgi:hypothetical protein
MKLKVQNRKISASFSHIVCLERYDTFEEKHSLTPEEQ